jgi:hypothetical protein
MKIRIASILLLSIGITECSAPAPAPVIVSPQREASVIAPDPETSIFASIRAELAGRYQKSRKTGSDSQMRRDADFLAMLDSIELSHSKVFRNNREHPEHPYADVLGLRKELFGR